MVTVKENFCKLEDFSSDYKKLLIAQQISHYILTSDKNFLKTMSFARLNCLYYLVARELFLTFGSFLSDENDFFMQDDENSYLFSDFLDTSLRNQDLLTHLNIYGVGCDTRLYANVPLIYYDRLNDTVYTIVDKLPKYDFLTDRNKEIIDKIIEKYKNEPLYLLIRVIKELPEYEKLANTDKNEIRYTDKVHDIYSTAIFLEDYL